LDLTVGENGGKYERRGKKPSHITLSGGIEEAAKLFAPPLFRAPLSAHGKKGVYQER
jgi:hypothetical protein